MVTAVMGLSMVMLAQAELTQLNDKSLSTVTGQSGVIVDIEVKGEGINIEQITYTDLLEGNGIYDFDSNGDGVNDAASGGTLVMQNITLKDIDNMRQTIEIKDNKMVIIDVEPVLGMSVEMGDTANSASNNYSALALSNEDKTRQSELLNSLALRLNLAKTKVHVYTNPSDSVLAAKGVTQRYRASNSKLFISMQSGLEVTNLDAQALGFTQAAAERKVRHANNLSADAPLTQSQKIRVQQLANGGALTIKGLKLYGKNAVTGQFAVNNPIQISQAIWADSSGFYMQSKALSAQLDIEQINAGQNRLGSLRVENIHVSPMLNRVYAH